MTPEPSPTTPLGEPAPRRSLGLVEPLSERELDVLRLLATDLDGPDIARQLFVSVNTMRTHTKSIYAKLGVNSRRAAVRRAEELGLLSRTPRPLTPRIAGPHCGRSPRIGRVTTSITKRGDVDSPHRLIVVPARLRLKCSVNSRNASTSDSSWSE